MSEYNKQHCETINGLVIPSETIGRLREILGIDDTTALVNVAVNMGVRFLEKIAAANVSVELESTDSAKVDATVYKRANEIALNRLNAPAPFTKEALVDVFSRFNISGVKPLKSEEADEFWDYLVMHGFKTSSGIKLNLSNVGGTLLNWRNYNENQRKLAAKRAAHMAGEETEDEKFARIRRNLMDVPED